jgi:putative phosphoesterase
MHVKTKMKIVVLADIHIHNKFEKIPKKVFNSLKSADMIFIVGDLVDLCVLDFFKSYSPIYAVCGNMDSIEVVKVLPSKRIIKVENVNIGLIHGSGNPATLPERVRKEFEKDNVNAIVFGHSHCSYNKTVNGVLLFNPGSLTDKIHASRNSFGILEVNNDKIKGEIIAV